LAGYARRRTFSLSRQTQLQGKRGDNELMNQSIQSIKVLWPLFGEYIFEYKK